MHTKLREETQTTFTFLAETLTEGLEEALQQVSLATPDWRRVRGIMACYALVLQVRASGRRGAAARRGGDTRVFVCALKQRGLVRMGWAGYRADQVDRDGAQMSNAPPVPASCVSHVGLARAWGGRKKVCAPGGGGGGGRSSPLK